MPEEETKVEGEKLQKLADEVVDEQDFQIEDLDFTVTDLEKFIENMKRDLHNHASYTHWGKVLRMAIPMAEKILSVGIALA